VVTDMELFLAGDDIGGSVCICDCAKCADGLCGRCEKYGPQHGHSWTHRPDKRGYLLPMYDKHGMLIHYSDEDLGVK